MAPKVQTPDQCTGKAFLAFVPLIQYQSVPSVTGQDQTWVLRTGVKTSIILLLYFGYFQMKVGKPILLSNLLTPFGALDTPSAIICWEIGVVTSRSLSSIPRLILKDLFVHNSPQETLAVVGIPVRGIPFCEVSGRCVQTQQLFLLTICIIFCPPKDPFVAAS